MDESSKEQPSIEPPVQEQPVQVLPDIEQSALEQSVQSQAENILSFAGDDPYIQASIVAVIAVFLAFFLTAILKRVLLQLVTRTNYSFDDQLAEIIRPPLFYTLLMVGLSIAIRMAKLPEPTTVTIITLLKTINIIIWMIFFIRFSKTLFRTAAGSKSKFKFVQIQTLPLFENLAKVIIIAMAIYMLFSVWGINMTAWLASAGVMGIAVGFAAKDTLANLISGVFILTDAPYKIGDYIILDSGERGEVTHIGIRSTRMLTRDDVELTIPNSIMGNSKVVNESGGPYEKFRFRINIGVAYGSDLEKVRQVLVEEANKNEDVCKSPSARVRFRTFGDSALDFQLMCWVNQPWMRGRVIDDLLMKIYNRFMQEGIEIPYNKQDIYIKEMPKSE